MRLRLVTFVSLFFATLNLVATPEAVSQTSTSQASCRDCGTIRSINERRPKGQGAWKNGAGDRGLDGLERRSAYSSVDNDDPTNKRGSRTSTGTPTKTYTRESADGSLSSMRRDNETGETAIRKRLWEVVIYMDGGGVKVVEYPRRPSLQVGDKVKVVGREVFVR